MKAELHGIFVLLVILVIQFLSRLAEKNKHRDSNGESKKISPDEIFEKIFGLNNKKESPDEQLAAKKVREEIMQLRKSREEKAAEYVSKSSEYISKCAEKIKQIDDTTEYIKKISSASIPTSANTYSANLNKKQAYSNHQKKIRSWIVGSIILDQPKSQQKKTAAKL